MSDTDDCKPGEDSQEKAEAGVCLSRATHRKMLEMGFKSRFLFGSSHMDTYDMRSLYFMASELTKVTSQQEHLLKFVDEVSTLKMKERDAQIYMLEQRID